MSAERLRGVLEQAERLARDTSLQAVRSWKERTAGLAVGFMPIYVPRELLHSQGVLPVGVIGGGDEIEIIRGDAYYQSYICHIPRSTIELGLDGSLDCLDGMIFPAICDVIRNLSGIWQLQAPEKYCRYFDVPQNFDPEVGGRFYRGVLAELFDDMCGLAGRDRPSHETRPQTGASFSGRHPVSPVPAARVRYLPPSLD